MAKKNEEETTPEEIDLSETIKPGMSAEEIARHEKTIESFKGLYKDLKVIPKNIEELEKEYESRVNEMKGLLTKQDMEKFSHTLLLARDHYDSVYAKLVTLHMRSKTMNEHIEEREKELVFAGKMSDADRARKVKAASELWRKVENLTSDFKGLESHFKLKGESLNNKYLACKINMRKEGEAL
jgi:hypothetical protein